MSKAVKNSKDDVKNRKEFHTVNLEGRWIRRDGVDMYVVFSYMHYPVFIYKEGTWYENANRYSNTTAKHMNIVRPTSDTVIKNSDEMKAMERGW